ncbi:MAG TPA: serine/threonine-protein kinase [Terracidiphilus sp.]|nr:serine/threonine-protein kinase [Terracidiphilus sp.]
MTQKIAQFRILGELGAGGMGIVYRALDTELGREVALKRLRSEFAASSDVLERFRNEARLQGRMSHPGIAQLYSLVQTPDAFCIAMELINGVMVKDLMPLDWRIAVAVILQVLDALGYAHSLGVLHRDIKPENVLIDTRGTVKIMDFGIAYAVGSERMTREKSVLGTIEYVPPERILNRPMDARSDIYSLGILLFELLSARLPFDLENDYDIMRWQIEGSVPQVSSVASVPAFFDRIVGKAMRKDPAERYATCSEMAADLQSATGDLLFPADGLQQLVTARIATARAAEFDAASCYREVAGHLQAGNLGAAEHVLQAEARRFPRDSGLLRYLSIVSRARLEIESPGGTSRDQTLCWLRMIAAERCGDRAAFAREIDFAADKLPGFVVATAHGSAQLYPERNSR